MSAPSGPARARASTRSRANTRGVGRSRDTPNGILTSSPGRRTAFDGATGSVSERQSKLGANNHEHRNKSLRNPPRSKPADAANGGKKLSSKNDAWRNSADDSASYKKHMADLYQSLKQDRDHERKEAIKNGFLADPDKPTSLAHAITPVGTCTDMCPQFERVERIVQLMVDGSEKQELATSGSKVPCEALMVKRFRRSAAGYDEQLPSDIRPPAVLKQTLDYLFNEVIGGPPQLATVHKFVWDRTRGIRNDFSIQQVTKTEDIRIAVECFERIARFHILSLHQLSRPDLKDNEFDHHQEREQLNNTLLSLMYYYDDSRHKLTSPNEAEFRAYCILFEIQNQRPDLEDRAQNWPVVILKDQRVQTAFKLYAAARNPSDEQGPLRPRSAFPLAQANTGSFWAIVRSNAVSYLTACVAEIYFNIVRGTALEAIYKAYKSKRGGATRIEDWVLPDMARALGFDSEEEAAQYCEEHDFVVAQNGNGDSYVDLSSVNRSQLGDSNPRRKQMFSRSHVETKRLGRPLSAVINGLSASDATSKGLIEESDVDYASDTNDESLFLPESSEEEQIKSSSRSNSPSKRENKSNGLFSTSNQDAPRPTSVFGQPLSSLKPRPQGLESFARNGENSQPINSTPSTSKANPFATQKDPQIDPAGDRPAISTGSSNPSSTLFKETPASFNPFRKPAGQPDQSSLEASSILTSKPQTFNPFQPLGGAQSAAQPATSSGAPAGSTFGRPSSSLPGQGPLNDKSFSFGSQDDALPFGGRQTQKSKTFGQPSQLKDTGDTANSQPGNQSEPPSLFQGLANATPTTKSTGAALAVPSQKKAQPVSNPEVRDSKPVFTFGSAPSETKAQPVSTSEVKESTPVFTFSSPRPQAPTNLSQRDPEAQSEQPRSAAPGNAQSTFTPFGPKHLSDSSAVFSKPANGSTTGQDPKPAPFPDITKLGRSQHASNEPSPTIASPAFRQTQFGGDPSRKDFARNLQPLSGKPNEPIDSLVNNEPQQVDSIPPPTAAPQKSDNRPRILDHLAQSLMMEEGGLLEQFVEFKLRPLMRTCALKFKDEQSWAVAREYRPLLLAKKYGRKWKANAWDLGLKRRGKERRQRLAKSMSDRAHRLSSQQNVDDKLSSASAADMATSILEQTSDGLRKRQSLPAQLSESRQSTSDAPAKNGAKRKRDEPDHVTDQSTPPPPKASHRRPNTLGASIMSAPPNRRSQKKMSSSVDPNRVGDGSLLGDILQRQVRRLAPHMKADTTQTTYFKLKAMGIDPDTPLVPATKKRPAPSTMNSSLSEASNKANDPSSDQLTKKPRLQQQKDDDEELFASLRAVRENLAEATTWFKSRRESMEKSLTPRTSAAPQDRSSSAQREAQGYTAKARTPTRTELRHKALGDKSLHPKGFWESAQAASEQSIKSAPYNRGEGRDMETPTKPMGFAALAKHGDLNGGSHRAAFGQETSQGAKKAAGASAEDAIEL